MNRRIPGAKTQTKKNSAESLVLTLSFSLYSFFSFAKEANIFLTPAFSNSTVTS